MKSLLLLLLLASAVAAQADKLNKSFDCVTVSITDGKAVVMCDSRNQSPECSPESNDEACIWAELIIPVESWPLTWGKASKGAVVRAEWIEGHLRPVKCKSEQMRGIYDRPPLNGGKHIDEGVDCSGPRSSFIMDLLEKTNKP